MKIKIAQIHFKDQKVEGYASVKVLRLEKFNPLVALIRIRLTKEDAHRNIKHSSFCELEFDISGKNFVIKDSEKDLYKAIDKATERAKILLVRHKEKEVSKKHKKALSIKSKKLKID